MAPSYHSESEDHQESLDFSGIEYQGICPNGTFWWVKWWLNSAWNGMPYFQTNPLSKQLWERSLVPRSFLWSVSFLLCHAGFEEIRLLLLRMFLLPTLCVLFWDWKSVCPACSFSTTLFTLSAEGVLCLHGYLQNGAEPGGHQRLRGWKMLPCRCCVSPLPTGDVFKQKTGSLRRVLKGCECAVQV